MALSDYKLKFVIDADGRTAKQELNSLYGEINKVGGAATSAFGGAIPVAATAAAGFLATAAAVVKVGTALYDITKTAAEYGSTIYDATQKTGLGATAISSLKIAADQSGSSLEAVTKGIAKFAKGYKGESEDLQAALSDVMKKVAEAKPGFEQLTLAQKYFGKAGADLIPVIRSFDGDLPGLIRHMEELGVTIDDKAAKAADEFGDQMDTLSAQVAGVGRTIGTELMPQFTSMAGTVSNWLAQNKGEIADYASRLGTLFGNIIRGFNAVKNWIIENQTYLRIGAAILTLGGSEVAIAGAQKLGSFLDTVSTARPTYGTEGGGGRKAIGGDFDMESPGGGKRGHRIAGSRTEKNDEMERFYRSIGATVTNGLRPVGSRIEGTNTLTKHGTGEAVDVRTKDRSVDQIFTIIVKSLEKGFRIYDERLHVNAKGVAQPHLHAEANTDKASTFYGNTAMYGGADKLAYLKELDKKRLGKATGTDGFEDFRKKTADDEKKAADEKAAQTKKFYEDWAAADQEAMLDRLDLRRSEADLAEEILRGQLLNGMIDEKEYADRVSQLRIDTLQNERDELSEQVQTRENINKIARLDLAITTEKLKKENDITDALRDQAEEREKAIKDLKKANQRPSKLKKRGQASDDGGLMGGIRRGMGVDLVSIWDETNNQVKDKADYLKDIYADLADFAGGAIGQMVDGLGQMAVAWLMGGEVSAKAALQMLASTAMNIATQAGFKAIFEYAEGLAALAVTWGVPNPSSIAHFAAAATYGTVAAVAGGAGVGLALGARAAGGGSSNGRDRGSSSGTASERPRDNENNPYSRVSSGAYNSGRNNEVSRLAMAVEGLDRKIGSMRPGDVMVRGMKEKPGAIGNQAVSDMRRNATTARAAGSVIGLR